LGRAPIAQADAAAPVAAAAAAAAAAPDDDDDDDDDAAPADAVEGHTRASWAAASLARGAAYFTTKASLCAESCTPAAASAPTSKAPLLVVAAPGRLEFGTRRASPGRPLLLLLLLLLALLDREARPAPPARPELASVCAAPPWAAAHAWREARGSAGSATTTTRRAPVAAAAARSTCTPRPTSTVLANAFRRHASSTRFVVTPPRHTKHNAVSRQRGVAGR
jgi:hypothetical protein